MARETNDLSVRSICPDGYRSLDSPRSTSGCRSAGQQGGGLVLIYRDSIGAKRIPIDLIPSTFEFVLAMLKLPRSNIVTLAIYRTGTITAEFFNEFASMLELLVVYNCPVLITGDINIHLDDPHDANAIKFNGILDSFGLIQSVVGPTHSLGWTLDIAITRNDLPSPIINVELPGEISDHLFLVFQLQLPRPPVNFVNVSMRAWKSFNEDSFRSKLRASKLCNPAEYDGNSVDDLQEMYDTTLRTLLDKHAPCQTARRRHQPTTPWFDADCATAKRKTRALEQQYRRTRLVSDRLAWSTQAQKKHQLYGRKQSEFWERKITESRGDTKKLWRQLKSVLRQKKDKPPNSEELTAEAFSNAFAEKLAGVNCVSCTPGFRQTAMHLQFRSVRDH